MSLPDGKRPLNVAKLAAVCARMGSDVSAERAAAASLANNMVRDSGLAWSDVLVCPGESEAETRNPLDGWGRAKLVAFVVAVVLAAACLILSAVFALICLVVVLVGMLTLNASMAVSFGSYFVACLLAFGLSFYLLAVINKTLPKGDA